MSEILTELVIEWIKEQNNEEDILELRKDYHQSVLNHDTKYFLMILYKQTGKGVTNIFIIRESSLGNMIQSLQWYKNRFFTMQQVNWSEVEDAIDERLEELKR